MESTGGQNYGASLNVMYTHEVEKGFPQILILQNFNRQAALIAMHDTLVGIYRWRCRCAKAPSDLAQTHPFVFLPRHTAHYTQHTTSTHFSIVCAAGIVVAGGGVQLLGKIVGRLKRHQSMVLGVPPRLKGFLYFGVIWIAQLLDFDPLDHANLKFDATRVLSVSPA